MENLAKQSKNQHSVSPKFGGGGGLPVYITDMERAALIGWKINGILKYH
jgi:hypothetical protein